MKKALKINFVKGCMGDDEIVLLYGNQIPVKRHLEVGVAALYPPYIGGNETGLLFESDKKQTLKLKMIGGDSRQYIHACGGLTQVLGKAIVELGLAKDFNIKIEEPITQLILKTDGGLIPVQIKVINGSVNKVTTDMSAFVYECYTFGVRSIKVANVDAIEVGTYLVINADDIIKKYPSSNFENIDKKTLDLLRYIRSDWNERYQPKTGWDFALYDLHSQHQGTIRTVFPHGVIEGKMEATCGTGTTAVGIAMVKRNELNVKDDGLTVRLLAECGGKPTMIGGPELLELRGIVKGKKLEKAFISHNSIKILSTGKLWV